MGFSQDVTNAVAFEVGCMLFILMIPVLLLGGLLGSVITYLLLK